MLVVCNHAGMLILENQQVPNVAAESVSYNFAYLGAFGVDVFFVISGFVMALSAQRFNGIRGAGLFLAHRYNRIAPLYYLASIVLLADLIRAGLPVVPLEVFNTITFVPWLDRSEYHWPIHYLGWTLAFEFVFYLVVGGLIATGRGREPVTMAALLIGLAAIGSLIGPYWLPLSMLTSPLMVEFAFGVLLFKAYHEGVFSRQRQLWRWLGCAAVVVLLLPALLSESVIKGAVTNQFQYGGALHRLLWWGLPAAAIVAAFLTLQPGGDSWLRRLASAVGDATYSIYLSHLFVVRLGQEAVERLNIAPVVVAVAILVISPIVGIACYRLVEAPLMRRGQGVISRWFGSGRRLATAPSSS